MILTQIDSVPNSAPVAASEQGGGDVVGARIVVTIESDGKAPVIVWSTPVDNNLAFFLRNKSEGVSDGSDTVTISVVIGKDVFVPVWKSPFLYPSWLEELMAGLHKRSMMLLDNCGLPKWFMELVCPPSSPDWGSLLFTLSDGLGYGYSYDYEVDTEDDE